MRRPSPRLDRTRVIDLRPRNDAVRFYVGQTGSSVKFEKPGTYEYTGHVTAGKVHSHTGTVVVK